MWEHLSMGGIQNHRSRFDQIDESIHKEEGPTLNPGALQCLEITPKGKPAKETGKGQPKVGRNTKDCAVYKI